jgi:hypothetical protein
LTSEAFNLASARSREAEAVLEHAAIALSDESFDQTKARELDAKLRGVLGDTDPFWTQWRYVHEKRGCLPISRPKEPKRTGSRKPKRRRT